MKVCKHKRGYYFHECAPMYCPDCDNYIANGEILPSRNRMLKQRKQKINKILTNIQK